MQYAYNNWYEAGTVVAAYGRLEERDPCDLMPTMCFSPGDDAQQRPRCGPARSAEAVWHVVRHRAWNQYTFANRRCLRGERVVMSPAPDRPRKPDTNISCNECKKNVPLSEARSVEAEDYVLYFCGLECSDRWHQKAESELQAKNSGRK